jgi:hypothetical protein
MSRSTSRARKWDIAGSTARTPIRAANARESGLGGVLLAAFFHLALPLLGLLSGRSRRVAVLPVFALLLIVFGIRVVLS